MTHLLFAVFVCSAAAAAVYAKKLTPAAGAVGVALATLIFWGVGWTGIALLGAFFLLGTFTTSWKKRAKERLGLEQEARGRTTGQVLANGGAAGLLGLSAILFPGFSAQALALMAASFSSAAADTVSSELGSVYGSRFYDILSFKPSRPGPDGVVSAEGLLFGVMASLLIAAVYATAAGWTVTLIWIVLAGTVGNLVDSYLGATLERKGVLGNNTVNLLNTLAGAATMALLPFR